MKKLFVYFEIIGKDADATRDYYVKLFGRDTNIVLSVATEIFGEGNYAFINNITTDDGTGVPIPKEIL